MNWHRALLTIGIVAATLSAPSLAQADSGSCPTAAGSYAGGAGTAGSPYLISTPEQLQRLRDDSLSWGAAFSVTAIIDMTSGGSTCTWTSGIGTATTPFTGSFDGNGREIVEVNIAPPVGAAVYAGLFGRVSGATISEVDFAGNVTAIAQADHGPIARAGTIVGWADGTSTITDSGSTGTVVAIADDTVAPGVANASVGGLVGLLDGTSTVSMSTSNATATSTVWADDSGFTMASGVADAGGLVGTASAGTTIVDSSALGAASATALQNISGSSPLGAQAGGLAGSSAGAVQRSTASGAATADGSSTGTGISMAGGLIGYVGQPGSVVDSYATGPSIATGGFDGDSLAGGLVGGLGLNSSATSSYALGSVTATESSQVSRQYEGSLIGLNLGTVSSAVAPNVSAPPTGNAADSGITWTSLAAMRDITTYESAGWNITDTWGFGGVWALCPAVNNSYPFLFAEFPSNPGCATAPGPDPTPPAPSPAAPTRDVTAVAGDASASVAWGAPASTGSFPVSTYQVTSSPGGRTCLVAAPALTCDVTGLMNGTAYTFTVRALTGAGWSAASEPSNAVTPRPESRPAVVITGARSGDRIKVSGTTSGFEMGGTLRPWLRFPGQSAYSQGAATILVSIDGTFEWGRRAGKKLSVYVQTPDASVRSNAVTIPAR